MAIIRCTQKLLSELKLKPVDCIDKSIGLGGWHANLIRVDRRKCILFTHDKTLFSFFVPGLTKPDFKKISDIFGQNLFKSLMREALPQVYIEMFLDDIRKLQFCKTNNRSVLGSMNDLIFHLKFKVVDRGGLANTDILKLNHDLNRIPMSAIKQTYSIDELKMLCEGLNR